MKTNYQTPLAELGYSEDYQRFLFDRLGLLGSMEEESQDYEEQGFSNSEAYAVYKQSQMSINDLINHMLDVIDVLEYEIDQLEQHQKQIKEGILKMKLNEAYDLIESCLDYDKSMSEHPERYEMVLQITAEVFQKQTPMKPYYPTEYPSACCPKCLQNLGDNNFCRNCGQKIDWSEE